MNDRNIKIENDYDKLLAIHSTNFNWIHFFSILCFWLIFLIVTVNLVQQRPSSGPVDAISS